MIRISGLVLAVAAALLVCCSAHSNQGPDANEGGERYDNSGHKTHKGSQHGNSGVGEFRGQQNYGLPPYFMTRRQDYTSNQQSADELVKPEPWKFHNFNFFSGEDYPKRNFDEIDLSGLNNFVKKRNFDEIDQTAMPFSTIKRAYHPYSIHYQHIPVSSFDKKRLLPDYLMEEIDLPHFPIGSKRSSDK